ncbi:MAG TPA: sigma-54 dependent transcriptional regulator [Thermoanaerobaculia bacterium]
MTAIPETASSTRTSPEGADFGHGSILIADDQRDILEALEFLLREEGFTVDTVCSPGAVLRSVERKRFDLVLVDLNFSHDTTSGEEGLDLITQLHAWDGTLSIVVMTAWASIPLVVEAMQRGARDFVEKPWDSQRLLTILQNQLELGRALRKGEKLETENRILRDEKYPKLIAQSRAMRPVLDLIERVGPSDANVLISGENGSGKGLVAQALHAVSRRARRTMVSVNVGGLSEGVFESELFGHVRGAFTDAKSDRVGRFELAEGGTLFLDEIANIVPSQQARLLRVLETGEYERVGSSQTRRADVRMISATNSDLHREVSEGRFREDLLFRLNTVEIEIPPLRERRDDVPLLAGHFLRQHVRQYHKTIDGFEDTAMKALMEHHWPGNVRELDHTIERGVLMATGRRLQRSDLALRAPNPTSSRLEEMSLEEVEGILIRKALARHDGSVKRAAEALGLSRSGLYRRLQRHGL